VCPNGGTLQAWQLPPTAPAYAPNPYPLLVETGDRVCILIRNFNADSHPFHLHGHHFEVIPPPPPNPDDADYACIAHTAQREREGGGGRERGREREREREREGERERRREGDAISAMAGTSHGLFYI